MYFQILSFFAVYIMTTVYTKCLYMFWVQCVTIVLRSNKEQKKIERQCFMSVYASKALEWENLEIVKNERKEGKKICSVELLTITAANTTFSFAQTRSNISFQKPIGYIFNNKYSSRSRKCALFSSWPELHNWTIFFLTIRSVFFFVHVYIIILFFLLSSYVMFIFS